MVRYEETAIDIRPQQLKGFFDGWPTRPSPETHLALLRGSGVIVLAIDSQTDAVVGFVTAISDRVLSAYIPLLEVLPSYRNQRIGSELVARLLARLGDIYMVDVVCDAEILPFYERLGFRAGASAMIRRRLRQGGGSLRTSAA
jgi:ribosomal protein S18 acetylase RimI-like enzyme